MDNPQANDRHKVDAVKALDALAAPEASRFASDADRIVIKIDLGADVRAQGRESSASDVLIINKPLKLGPHNNEVVDAIPNNSIDEAPARRKRGRPRGSRNKPKTKEAEELPFTDGGGNGDAV
jgi:hypothetical protein